MPDGVSVTLFVEDRAHEGFLKPLIQRVAQEADRNITIRSYSARGGHPRALDELQTFQTLIERGVLGLSEPDILVVGIDANCSPWHKVRQGVLERLASQRRSKAAVACPDPHIERWFMADPTSFEQALGRRPRPGKRKCEQDRYKRILAKTVREAGYPVGLGGIEFAEDIVAAMDLYRAGKNEKSLKHFLDATRSLLTRGG
jgi:hypothetical protein